MVLPAFSRMNFFSSFTASPLIVSIGKGFTIVFVGSGYRFYGCKNTLFFSEK